MVFEVFPKSYHKHAFVKSFWDAYAKAICDQLKNWAY
jgi:hypothetical protein